MHWHYRLRDAWVGDAVFTSDGVLTTSEDTPVTHSAHIRVDLPRALPVHVPATSLGIPKLLSA
jgi:hypothetical protein